VDKAPDAFRTISEVAEELNLPQHVLRFWETRFSQIRPMKRGGGRRYYRPDDVDLLRGIRHLLYGEGYTIRGVQRILKDHGVKFVQTVWQVGAPQPAKSPGDVEEPAPGPERSPGAPGRGLFRLLPGLLGSEDDAEVGAASPIEDITPDDAAEASGLADEDREPGRPLPAGASALRPRPRAAAATPAGAGGGLAREDIRKLETTLVELTECRRLLDAILTEKP